MVNTEDVGVDWDGKIEGGGDFMTRSCETYWSHAVFWKLKKQSGSVSAAKPGNSDGPRLSISMRQGPTPRGEYPRHHANSSQQRVQQNEKSGSNLGVIWAEMREREREHRLIGWKPLNGATECRQSHVTSPYTRGRARTTAFCLKTTQSRPKRRKTRREGAPV